MMLHISDIECGYGAYTVLRAVNLTIERGELIGIIGPNGSGKTTLLRAITAVIPLKRGEIIFKDVPVNKMSRRDVAKKISCVSQTREDLFFNMTVEQIVLLGRIPYFTRFQWIERKKDMEIVEKSMRLTDLLSLRNREISSLSGGEKQRVFIARALAQEPELLLLDEPTSHLDITHQVGILNLIKGLNRKSNLTVIMVLHDLNLASEYCHRLVLLNEGGICKIGYPEEVMDYKILEKVYKTVIVVEKSPVSSKPHIFVVSEEGETKKERREFD